MDKFISNKNLKNGLWLYLLQAFNTIIPLITLPYITRVLGADGYGVFSIALNIIAYIQVLIEYGFAMSATREVAVSNKNQAFLNKLFSSIIVVRLLLFILSFVIVFFYLMITHANRTLSISIYIMLICLLGYCFQLNWLFQGMQEMKYISIITIIARLASTILIFILVKKHTDIIIYSLLYSIAPLISGLLGFAIARINYSIRFVSVSITDIANQFKNGWYVFTTQLSAKVFSAIGVTFLGVLSTESVVGSFAAIQKIPTVILLAWAPISQVLYPIISQRMDENYYAGKELISKYRRIFIPIFCGIGIILSITSKSLVRIAFGIEYEDFYYWIFPLLLWVIVSIYNNFLGIQTLLASGHDKEYSIAFQISVLFTILINFICVYFFEGDGAAIAPLLSEIILTITLVYQIRRVEIVNMEK